MNAAPSFSLTPLALQTADILRLLTNPDCPATLKAMATSLGRDDSNLNKTLKVMAREGLAEAARPFSPTNIGKPHVRIR